MNCEEFRAGHLAGDADERLAAHLEGCAACRSRLGGLDASRRALADPALWEEPSPQLADQVMGLIAASPPAAPVRRRVWPISAAVAAMIVAVVALGLSSRLTGPDWEVHVPGTEAAPQASATVEGWNTDSGTRMRMTTTGLDDAPEGYVYELWLSEGPRHISAGTFRAGGKVELWAGVSRGDYPRLWVTLERLDAYEGPSDATVLDTGA